MSDKLFINQTKEDFQEVFKPKMHSVKNLDEVTRKFCIQLDHFDVFSSFVSGIGNNGQTNYGMANSILERICEKRKMEGLPALAVQYGIIGQVDIMENIDRNKTVSEFRQLNISCYYGFVLVVPLL